MTTRDISEVINRVIVMHKPFEDVLAEMYKDYPEDTRREIFKDIIYTIRYVEDILGIEELYSVKTENLIKVQRFLDMQKEDNLLEIIDKNGNPIFNNAGSMIVDNNQQPNNTFNFGDNSTGNTAANPAPNNNQPGPSHGTK